MTSLQTFSAAAALATVLIGSTAQATTVPAVPIPPGVGLGVIIVNELAKPKPFCRLIKVFKKKNRC